MTAATPTAAALAPVTEFGCIRCQKWHRHGLDPEFATHLNHVEVAKHCEPRRRAPKPAEVLRRVVEGLDCSVPSLPSWGLT